MFNNKRIAQLNEELFVLKAKLEGLLQSHVKLQINLEKDIRDSFNRELAQYRAKAEGTVTDRIKFDVLQEWIEDVFKLNNLKFSQQDFIKHDKELQQEMSIREKIAKEIEEFEIAQDLSNPRYAKTFPPLQEALAKMVRKQ